MSRNVGHWVRQHGINALAIGAVATGLALGVAWLSRKPEAARRVDLLLTAGDLAGDRARVAEAIARASATHPWLRVHAVATGGSEEAVRRIEQGGAHPGWKRPLALALVQGGFRYGDTANVAALATGAVEPLHVLIRDRDIDATDLRGKAVNVGVAGSGTALLAQAVLEFEGLDASSYRAEHRTYRDLIDSGHDALPDAIFTVSTLPSPVAEALIRSHDYHLLALPYAEAFALSGHGDAAAPVAGLAIDPARVERAIIPAATYRRAPEVPAADLPTFGVRQLLIGRADLPDDVVMALLEVAQVASHALAEPIDAELRVHAGAQAYFDQFKPLISAHVVEMANNLIGIAQALGSAAFFLGLPLLAFFRAARRRKRDRFETYIARVAKIERRALEMEAAPTGLDLTRLRSLSRDLTTIKAEAVEKFAEGEIAQGELMMGFLAQLNDAQEALTRMILYQRQRADEQYPPLWDALQALNALGGRVAALAGGPAGRAEWVEFWSELDRIEQSAWSRCRPEVPNDHAMACELARGANLVRLLLAFSAPRPVSAQD